MTNMRRQFISAVTSGVKIVARSEEMGLLQFPRNEFLPIHVPRVAAGTYSEKAANNVTRSAPSPNPIIALTKVNITILGETAARYIVSVCKPTKSR